MLSLGIAKSCRTRTLSYISSGKQQRTDGTGIDSISMLAMSVTRRESRLCGSYRRADAVCADLGLSTNPAFAEASDAIKVLEASRAEYLSELDSHHS